MTNTRPNCYAIPSHAIALLWYRKAQEKKVK
jgi:hypothetical protein